MIPKDLLPLNGLVDIFCVHTRLNETALKEVLYDDTVWITILREPTELYESLYGFYGFEKTLNVSLEEIVDIPIKVRNIEVILLTC